MYHHFRCILLFACCYQSVRSCKDNVFAIEDSGSAWESGACSGNLNRAVVKCAAEINLIKNEMRENQMANEMWIDFALDISASEFSNGSFFLGIRLNFSVNEPSKCLVFRFNESANEFAWGLSNCHDRHNRVCMNGSRRYWNKNGTNNPLPKPFPVSRPPTLIELEQVISGCFTGRVSDCNYTAWKDSPVQHVVRNSSECHETVRLGHYSASCLDPIGNARLAVAEITSNFNELNNLTEKFDVPIEDTQTRRTTLHPPESKLISINIVDDKQPDTPSSAKVRFQMWLNYNRIFRQNSYNLTFESGEEGLLRSTYRYIDHEPIGVFLQSEGTTRFDTTGIVCTGKETVVRCTSNHTTVFAVLLSVETLKLPSSLKVLAIILQSISIFFLFLTFLILLIVRKRVSGERIPIQINLSISLLLLNFWILWGDIAMFYPHFCRALAVLIHFFLLSSALWMMNEATLLFFKTSKWAVLATKRRKIVVATMCIGWGIPFIITGITAIVGFSNNTYMEKNEFMMDDSNAISKEGLLYKYCWLSTKDGMRLAAIVPVAIIISYNLIIAVRSVVFVNRKRSEARRYIPTDQEGRRKSDIHSENIKNISHSLKVIFLLLPVLGVPWILLLLSNWGSQTLKLRFLYANTLINGLQGLFIFLIYCVADTKVRSTLSRSLTSESIVWLTSLYSRDKKRRKHDTSNQDATNTIQNAVPARTHTGETLSTDVISSR